MAFIVLIRIGKSSSFSEEEIKSSYFMGCARKCASVSSATNFGCSSTMK
jgi:hypothetical protein